MDVYRERAHFVAHLAKLYPSVVGADPAEPDWAVVYVETPKGQLGWHISPDDMDLFSNIPFLSSAKWDGHTTEEKYERLRALS